MQVAVKLYRRTYFLECLHMSLDTLSKLERALGITLILDEEYDNLPIGMVAEDMPPYSR